MRLKERGETLEFNFTDIDLQTIQPETIQGILPVIINITPVTNLPLLLGLAPQLQGQEISKL